MKVLVEVKERPVEEKRTHSCKQCRVISLGQGKCPECGQTMFPWDHGTSFRLRWIGGVKMKQKMKERAEAIAYWRALEAKGELK